MTGESMEQPERPKGYDFDDHVRRLGIDGARADVERQIRENGPFKPRSAAVKTVTKPMSAEPELDWPEPDGVEKLTDLPAPTFPDFVLPDAPRDWALDVAHRQQINIEMVAIPMLVTLAGCIGSKISIRPKANDDDWNERACLWGVVISAKGTLKTPAQKAATAPLLSIEAHHSARYERELADWNERVKEVGERRKAWKKECAKALVGNANAEMPAEPEACKNLGPKPVRQRFVIVNATIEKLGILMSESRGLTMIQDELSALLLNMHRYSDGSDRPFYLTAHSGGPYTVDRVSKEGALFVPDVYLNIIGGIQPDIAKQISA